MKKISAVVALCFFAFLSSQAQYYGRPMRPYHRYRPYPVQRNLPPFTPSVSLSVGYGFPNLDKDQLVQFYHFYQGSVNQTGPIHASLDYQFSRFESIGVMASYGKVSAPYYDYNTNALAANGSLEAWSVMLNLVHYIPAGRVVNPYLRTAIGVNVWNQKYTDETGSAIPVEEPGMLAYQASLGAKFRLDSHTAAFIEAGYGKYILSAGLSLKL